MRIRGWKWTLTPQSLTQWLPWLNLDIAVCMYVWIHVNVCLFILTHYYLVCLDLVFDLLRFWSGISVRSVCSVDEKGSPSGNSVTEIIFARSLDMYLMASTSPWRRRTDWINLGLARTVYIHRIWPYIWWFSCQKYRIYTVYIWFWPTLDILDGSIPSTMCARLCVFPRFSWSIPPLLLPVLSCFEAWTTNAVSWPYLHQPLLWLCCRCWAVLRRDCSGWASAIGRRSVLAKTAVRTHTHTHTCWTIRRQL